MTPLSAATTTVPDERLRIPPDEANRGRRRIGCFIVGALMLASPFLLVGGLFFIVTWSGGRLLADAKERARAAGDPTTVDEMNAFYPTSPDIQRATAHWQYAIAVVDSPDFKKEAVSVPILGQPGIAYDDRGLMTPEQSAEAAAFLAKWQEAIDASHTARAEAAVARFPVEFEDGIAMLLPHVQNMRAVCNLLHLDCEVNLVRGDLDAAVEDLLSMVAASESLTNEPVLVSQLVRFAILHVAATSTKEAIDRVEFSDAQLARLQEAFARQDFAPSMQRWARGEQFWLLVTSDTGKLTGDRQLDQLRWLPTHGADVAKSLEIWRPVIDAGEEGMLPMAEALQTMEADVEKLAASNVSKAQYPMTLMFLPAVAKAGDATIRAQATARLTTAAIACERYRLAHGDWPAKIDDLAPEFLPALPLDPFDEAPLAYVVEADGVLLYSIGSNFRDDGGVDDPQNGDIVVRLRNGPAPAEPQP